jgi:hypothetical protein
MLYLRCVQIILARLLISVSVYADRLAVRSRLTIEDQSLVREYSILWYGMSRASGGRWQHCV